MVHQYRSGGLNIVLDTCSGSVHVVDDVAFDIISMFKEKDPEQITDIILEKYRGHCDVTKNSIHECIRDIASLESSNKLFSPDTYEELSGTLKDKDKGIIKALCLHIAHSCNLCCSYCFAGQGRYQGKSSLMSFDTGKRSLDFLIEKSGNRRNLEVDFFGGEPLLNWEVVKELVLYARNIEKRHGKNFRFTLTTNGVLIDDDVISFCNEHMSNVVLSLDGRKEVHDRYRVDRSNKGSFDLIVPKFQKFVKERSKNYYMRGTFTHSNPDFLEDIKCMLDLGFTELSMEPVVTSPDSPEALTRSDLDTVKAQYDALLDLMLERDREGKPFTFYHYMIDLKSGPCIYKRISGCGSGTEYMAVTPSGDLYPCHQFVGDESFRLGDIWTGVTNKEKQEEFRSSNVYTKPECKECWARLYCAGGCAANAYHASGSIKGIYEPGCELFRKRLECAISLEAHRQIAKK